MIIRPRWTLVAMAAAGASLATWLATGGSPAPRAQHASLEDSVCPGGDEGGSSHASLTPAMGAIVVGTAREPNRPFADGGATSKAAGPRTALEAVEAAETLLGKGRWKEALAELERALQLDSSCSQAHFTAAMVYAGRGLYSRAIASLEAGLAIKPDDMSMRMQLALIHEKIGNTERAYDAVVAAANCTPPVAEMSATLAKLLGKPQIARALDGMGAPRPAPAPRAPAPPPETPKSQVQPEPPAAKPAVAQAPKPVEPLPAKPPQAPAKPAPPAPKAVAQKPQPAPRPAVVASKPAPAPREAAKPQPAPKPAVVANKPAPGKPEAAPIKPAPAKAGPPAPSKQPQAKPAAEEPKAASDTDREEVRQLTKTLEQNPHDPLALNNLAVIHSRTKGMRTFAEALFGVLETQEKANPVVQANLTAYRKYASGQARSLDYGKSGKFLTLAAK